MLRTRFAIGVALFFALTDSVSGRRGFSADELTHKVCLIVCLFQIVHLSNLGDVLLNLQGLQSRFGDKLHTWYKF